MSDRNESAVQLLYFDGCPNVEAARRNLKAAMARASVKDTWTDVDLQSRSAPPDLKGFPSPTVLIDGVDVTTAARNAEGNGACRAGGAPSVEAIFAGLNSSRRTWLTSAAAAPAALMGLAPGLFCPACYPALVALLSSMGLGALVTDAILPPLMAALLLVALAGLGLQARRRRAYWSLLPGVTGAVGVYVGLFLVASTTLRVFGVVLLVGASACNLIDRFWSKNTENTCPSCE